MARPVIWAIGPSGRPPCVMLFSTTQTSASTAIGSFGYRLANAKSAGELPLRSRVILVSRLGLRLGPGLFAELPVRRPGFIVMPDQRPILLRGTRLLGPGGLA